MLCCEETKDSVTDGDDGNDGDNDDGDDDDGDDDDKGDKYRKWLLPPSVRGRPVATAL